MESEPKDYKLSHKWSFYDHIKCTKDNYNTSINKIGTCENVIEFWNCYDNIPKPSEIFYMKDNNKFYKKPYYNYTVGTVTTKRYISSLSFFKESFEPLTEKYQNLTTLTYVTTDTSYKIDDYWLELTLKCINNTQSSDYNELYGFRIIDSSLLDEEKVFYKIELWLPNEYSVNFEKKFRYDFKINYDTKIKKIVVK